MSLSDKVPMAGRPALGYFRKKGQRWIVGHGLLSNPEIETGGHL